MIEDDAADRKCPDCKGVGSITLLISISACPRCGGAGRMAASPKPAETPKSNGALSVRIDGPREVHRKFDAQGRLVREVWPATTTIKEFRYGAGDDMGEQ